MHFITQKDFQEKKSNEPKIKYSLTEKNKENFFIICDMNDQLNIKFNLQICNGIRLSRLFKIASFPVSIVS